MGGGGLAHVVDEQDGDVELAMEGAQGAEDGGDVAGAVLEVASAGDAVEAGAQVGQQVLGTEEQDGAGVGGGEAAEHLGEPAQRADRGAGEQLVDEPAPLAGPALDLVDGQLAAWVSGRRATRGWASLAVPEFRSPIREPGTGPDCENGAGTWRVAVGGRNSRTACRNSEAPSAAAATAPPARSRSANRRRAATTRSCFAVRRRSVTNLGTCVLCARANSAEAADHLMRRLAAGASRGAVWAR
jgi:hypothetical protein